MNDSEFGLTASIWTKDTVKGEDLAEHVEAGTVFVNRCDFPSPVSRFGIERVIGILTEARILHGLDGRIPAKESR